MAAGLRAVSSFCSLARPLLLLLLVGLFLVLSQWLVWNTSTSSASLPSSPPPPPCPHCCPLWFRFIEADLHPWRGWLATREYMDSLEQVLMAKMPRHEHVHFRVQIVDGQLFSVLDQLDFHPSFKSRAMFTLWGLLMMLRRYPGRIPNVDLIFFVPDRCPQDWLHHGRPPFLSCASIRNRRHNFGFLWPDWTFWGWPALHIPAWPNICPLMAASVGPWQNRTPHAYWKGNPETNKLREKMLQCDREDAPQPHPYGMELKTIVWSKEYGTLDWETMRLENQCKYRYLLYMEGWGWSVSLKYALCCGSTVLAVQPEYHDFFGRALVEERRVWVVPRWPWDLGLCSSILRLVQGGNQGRLPAEQTANAAQDFALQDIDMRNVYDYMYHAVRAASTFIGYTPEPTPGTVQVTEEWLREIAPKEEAEYFKVDTTSDVAEPCELRPAN